ncbi:uncharacterized protein LACBIDRAFT_305140 [Laccaria bicolor S238N-H82]|uniref:Predicted protein n=1 Tax=Laccaria bicolor (strain S238N-H82 / ATCC MYA-4686) TaxID=486041 RepID=B0CTI2_LACBS|nr:uncharacterized protein LACBIDRAFT_305140 [Laccaria bicolor S238N-H82]EDR13928.1 predicted protein [Laccaria bicolor S238N-H82]|eukprot:XP_001874487.1 predicted protein [Laccaria bicolor S238N-H82]
MSELQHSARKNSPPLTPPSPDTTDAELKLSRKREREVSLEPLTPSTIVDTDPLLLDRKDTRTPAKKNRRRLDTTEEEDDGLTRSRSNSGSPPLSVSPPQEMKMRVRQISQGVEDLSWRNMQATTPDKDADEDNAGLAPGDAQDVIATQGSTVDIKVDSETQDESPPKTPEETQLMPSQSMMDASPAVPRKEALSEESTFRLRSDSESGGDKGLKRKFLERGTSQGPPETVDTSGPEPLKRPRDEADGDDNPRETKRPSPPPEPKSPRRPSPPSPKASKPRGFMAYASTSSPFASVKGQNLFASSNSNKTPPPPSIPAPAAPLSASIPKLGESSTSSNTPTATKRSGFEAFSSSASPFASIKAKLPVSGSTAKLGRAKSPPRRTNTANLNATNPFASYAGTAQSFAVPMQKRARAGSPNGSARSSLERNPTVGVFGASTTTGNNNGSDSGAEDDGGYRSTHTSFGARLRAGKDEDEESKSEEEQSKVLLTEQDVVTGEEEEETIHQVRGKLFSLVGGNTWKERGTGLLKLNVKRDDGTGARLVMRKEAVYTLLLNVTLFSGMRCSLAQDPRYLRFSIIEAGATTHYNLRVSNAKIAQELLEEINANIPL